MNQIINELSNIRMELAYGVEGKDFIYIKMQINRIDTLINNLVKNLNEETVKREKKRFIFEKHEKLISIPNIIGSLPTEADIKKWILENDDIDRDDIPEVLWDYIKIDIPTIKRLMNDLFVNER